MKNAALESSRKNQEERGGAAVPSAALPPVSTPVVRWFVWYSQRYLRRHFHSLRVSRAGLPAVEDEVPLVIYLNHAAWWDPLVVLLLTHEFFPHRTFYAPMDARALERYGFFRRIGCFGVEPHSLRGAKQFLGTSLAVMDRQNGGLCVTPQGRFADARERPVQFEAGLGQLARRMPEAIFVPLAVEYVFWEERSPEVLARFGAPLSGRDLQERARSIGVGENDVLSAPRAEAFTSCLEEQLATTQDALAAESQSRDASRFINLLSGSAGVGGVYDSWRRVRCWLRGERFVSEHSSL